MSTPRRLIINADDLGYDPAVTRGILEAMQRGVVSSATLMVNAPHGREAARLARGLALGLHLNLARWAPVSSAVPDAMLREGSFDEAMAELLSAKVVEAETLAQLALLQTLTGQRATHLDVHKHLHRHPWVLEGVARAAQKERLPVRALDPSMRAFLRARGVAVTHHFVGEAGAEAYWTAKRFRRALAALQPGLTELMCHPGYAPTEVRSGYGPQREVELLTFTSPAARDALAASGVERVDFRVLGGAVSGL